ncbi:Stp1/IreP family PP2C-type Ser/Thr phosphatase [Virgibacillus sp. 179-BFC.A HS]|uniref:Stp1/IreP family PP2C-type Ser/Thr phosphatase n=1 Tax=Tigheibacillus jepli TaxID=3035914 RepID=A0ABU5CJ06_9BACI|nr:Stp1/IreP family PP2C-type Ser/Thr phosphatase [Virgibacillus sp. 179-BFC.A HS]MDY0405926.1 Stp1/IreP family PP2C-type Ser/Thr phosphatase [Virgibacillus sp. 179-BFC.A HS]
MEGQFMTDTGRVRAHNEDSGGVFKNDTCQQLAIIADGMGGHQAGDVASQMAADILKKKWQAHKEAATPDETEKWLNSVLHEINQEIFAHSLSNEECRGMGTTIVLAVCAPDFVTISHIGDSRCYLYSNGKLNQVTEDHSLVNELVRSGEITKEDAKFHPQKNVVLKALGTEETVKPDIQTLNWEKGDKLLLCSDGLTDKVDDREIAECFASSKSIREIGDYLIRAANERGGEDNISLVIMNHQHMEAGENSC